MRSVVLGLLAAALATAAYALISPGIFGFHSVIGRVGSGTATAAPTVTAVLPGAGSTLGGTTITITGTQFVGLSGAAAVKFGATNAASYIVLSSTSISAVSPAHVAATIDGTVTNPIGTSATSAADQFTFSASSCGVLDLSTGCSQLVAFGGLF